MFIQWNDTAQNQHSTATSKQMNLKNNIEKKKKKRTILRKDPREYIVYDSSSNWENLTTVLSIIYLGGKIINKSKRVIDYYSIG